MYTTNYDNCPITLVVHSHRVALRLNTTQIRPFDCIAAAAGPIFDFVTDGIEQNYTSIRSLSLANRSRKVFCVSYIKRHTIEIVLVFQSGHPLRRGANLEGKAFRYRQNHTCFENRPNFQNQWTWLQNFHSNASSLLPSHI